MTREAFIGPLQPGLVRDEWSVGGVKIAYGLGPREVVLAAAALLSIRGREYTLDVTDDSVYLYSMPPRWFDTAILVHACKPGQRWKFLRVEAGSKRKSRRARDVASIVDTYSL